MLSVCLSRPLSLQASMPPHYQLPDPTQRPFARTNVQTIRQRAVLLHELLPDTHTIAQLCCGDCSAQSEIYRSHLPIERYVGLDLQPEIVGALEPGVSSAYRAMRLIRRSCAASLTST